MAKRVSKNHYVAAHRASSSPIPIHITRSSAYSDGEESHRAPSDRTISEYTSVPYTIVNEVNGEIRTNRYSANPPRAPSAYSNYENGSDIYITSAAYRAASDISRGSRTPRAPSRYSYRSGRAPSVASSARTRTSRKAGLTLEAMSAPNPMCPSIKGMCCLMLLLNLGIILITLGFVIVIQFFEPIWVWIMGIIFLIFGFLTLIGSLVYCVVICKDVKSPQDVNPEDLYWTHHWQKNIGSPEAIHYHSDEKYPHDDRYSDRYSIGKASGRYSSDNRSRSGRY